MMTRASHTGHYTPADVYPYLAGITGLQDLLIPGLGAGWRGSGHAQSFQGSQTA